MSLACGIVGLPNVGKSTIFNAITAAGAESANYPFCTIEPNIGVVDVPDANLELIKGFIPTERIIPAALKIVDIAGLVAGASQGEGLGNKFLGNIKECDAILHVVRCFESGDIIHVSGSVDPQRDIEVIELELGLADLDTVARALDRAAKKARAQDKDAMFEKDVLERAKAWLESGKQLRNHAWTPQEAAVLYPLFLITMKPVLFVANVADSDLDGQSPLVDKVRAHAAATGAEVVALSGAIEGEIMALEPADRAAFLADMGLTEPGLHRLIRSAYHLLGLQVYYTAGPKEIRAWTIHKGDSAPKAAGVIHTDFEKGFIRAEIYSVDELVQYKNEAAIKAAGKMRSEGREYVMRPNDVCHFLIGK
ncbi:MAG: redox-regulated ATPase YchF [Planctomycetes bacterium]|nr:redox-regulated ATPase YchF [Planctomycetota bacterium]